MPTIKEILTKSIQQLKQKNINSACLDAEILLSNALKKPKEFLYAHLEYKVPREVETQYFASLQKRLAHEPIAYIIGYKEFCGLKFYVDKNVLIPRPESEMICKDAMNRLFTLTDAINGVSTTVIDIGTGSGCLIISLAKKIPKEKKFSNINFIATDISKSALKIALKNAKLHQVNKNITFLQGNLLEPYIIKTQNFHQTKLNLSAVALAKAEAEQEKQIKSQEKKHLIILANLPYLSKNKYSKLQIEIKKYEPKIALFDNQDELKLYKEFFEQTKKLLDIQVDLSMSLILEHSEIGMSKLFNLAKKYFPKSEIKIKKDLAGLKRMMVLES